ncbi:MAG: AccI family restriction endonuclease [Prosthecobacter sp.]|jgi:hypothetical protein|uniref:AccI family restriction endonuclease n=1 Tax=Prosthecobacter sp. TaxID=1965333 RepID=UPI0019EA2CEE|nr:AccI family restriction endonuclease [Prosthecobacter sp.]MBE2284817.1 AccI family restriction endonuclease [Prosthecobacter sp.]
MNTAYLAKLRDTVPGVIATLERKGIEARHLGFGGEGNPPAKKITAPTDARSEFLANRAMGDWAEHCLARSLRCVFPDFKIVQYGNTDRIAAGHPDFKARYLAGIEETRRFGKRPDLLLLAGNVAAPDDISELSHADSDAFVNQGIASIEVRSSKFEALTYMRVRQLQREAGNKAARETPSFTVKVEDLIIVYRWLERYGVVQSYCQVFFDSIFAINFLDIFSIISSGSGFTIETPAKSQEKATIMIPITCGAKIGTAMELPRFEAEHRVTELGRHDAFVVPTGGGFSLDAEATRRVLLPAV